MLEHAADNPDALAWHIADGMIRAFLPESPWAEEVVSIRKGSPGRLEVARENGLRRYWFRRCPLTVRPSGGGEPAPRLYSFAFDWSEGRWQLGELPAVCLP